MTVDYDVPFYGNTPDDTHCASATYRMIRGYFEPQLQLSWDEIDQATGKTGRYATWRVTAWLWMASVGYDVKALDMFDFNRFANDGLPYLYEFYGPANAGWLATELNMPVERERSRLLEKHNLVEKRLPTQADIEQFLDAGFLVQLTVNLNRLNGKFGYFGHGVVVKGYDSDHFLLHDPGLPPVPNRLVHRDDFEAAWSDPAPSVKDLCAFRKASTPV